MDINILSTQEPLIDQKATVSGAKEMIRQEMIRLLIKLDPLGCYSDVDSLDNGVPIMTLDESIQHVVEAILLYEKFMNSH